MSQQLADELRWLQASRVKETLKKGWAEVPVWVFCNEDGKPRWKSNWPRGGQQGGGGTSPAATYPPPNTTAGLRIAP